MMDFDLSVEKKLLRDTVRDFMKKECPREFVRELDANPRFPVEIIQKLASLGLTGLLIPEEYGGCGGDLLDLVIVHEEMCRVSPAISMSFGVASTWGSQKIANFGTQEQKTAILPRIARGELVFASATTECDAGTDILGGIQTTAEVDGKDFIINGAKNFISAAHIADYIIVTCITDPEARRTRGLSQIIVPTAGTPGLEIRPIEKIAIKAAGFNEVLFDKVRTPCSNLLGKLNHGWPQFFQGHASHLIIGAAQALGVARAAFMDTMHYAKGRKTFGRAIGQYQLVQDYITEMATDIEISAAFLYQTAWKAVNGRNILAEALMLNKFTSRMTFKTVGHAMSIFGAYGLTTDFDIQRYYRDARHFVTTPMNNEMITSRLAMCLGLPKSY